MDSQQIEKYIHRVWDSSVLPTLFDYIRIPNKSPHFDADWQQHGYMSQAVALVAGWCRQQPIAGLTVEVLELPGRTPLLAIEVPEFLPVAPSAPPGTPPGAGECVLLYGHLDKQPEMAGWDPELGPWTPVLRGDRLYGRGSADDGYAAFAALSAIAALQQQGLGHGRCILLIEASEESGSPDLPAYMELLSARIGTPSLVICLDSSCGNYEQLWCTTSLRGAIAGTLTVEILTECVHSGDAGGIVPSSFLILRQLLSRLEDEATGTLRLPELFVEIPAPRREQAVGFTQILGTRIWEDFPWVSGARQDRAELIDLVLNRTWAPSLAVTGAAGLPSLEDAGNVIRPMTALRLVIRIPPTCPAEPAYEAVRRCLLRDPPYGAKVTFTAGDFSMGWDAPALAPWLADSLRIGSQTYFGREAVFLGDGGSIPFMWMLGKRYPSAQFLITGVLGPQSNAHGPNEFLHVPTAKKLSCALTQVLTDHQRAAHPAPPKAA